MIMRTPTLMTLAGALALSASAFAAPSTTPAATSAAIASVNVNAPAYKLQAVEFEGVQGVYKLSNGQVMRVSAEQRKLYMELDGGARSEIVAVGQNTFVARQDDTRLVFDQIPFATDVYLTRR
jgi:hypothetical protein